MTTLDAEIAWLDARSCVRGGDSWTSVFAHLASCEIARDIDEGRINPNAIRRSRGDMHAHYMRLVLMSDSRRWRRIRRRLRSARTRRGYTAREGYNQGERGL